MGFLQGLGQSIGAAFAPAATAQGAAGASPGWGTLATGVNAGANIAAGIGGLEENQFKAKVAGMNAEAALRAGTLAEQSSKLKYGALEAEQKVAQAANGVQVGSGSALAVRESTERISAMDAALIHYNAARQAFGEAAQAQAYKAAGVGALAKGLSGAATSFLSGANSLSDKWLAYQRSGAMAGG